MKKIISLLFIGVVAFVMTSCTTETIVHMLDDNGELIEVARIKQDSRGVAQYTKETIVVTEKDGKTTKTDRVSMQIDTDEDGNFFTRNFGSMFRDATDKIGKSSPL